MDIYRRRPMHKMKRAICVLLKFLTYVPAGTYVALKTSDILDVYYSIYLDVLPIHTQVIFVLSCVGAFFVVDPFGFLNYVYRIETAYDDDEEYDDEYEDEEDCQNDEEDQYEKARKEIKII